MKQIRIQDDNRVEVIRRVIMELRALPEEKKLEVVIRDPVRTSLQNRAVHKFFTWIAEMLNDKGMYLSKDLLKEGYEAEWTGLMVKEIIWRPTQKTLTDKQSSAKLTTAEFSLVADTVQQGLAKKGLDISFPSLDSFYEDD